MDWTKYQDKAYNQIKEKGKALRIVVGTFATFDALNDTFATGATTSYSTYGLFTALKRQDQTGAQAGGFETGFTTRVENAVILIPAKGLPQLDGEKNVTIYSGTKTYLPRNIEVLQPGGINIMFKVQVK